MCIYIWLLLKYCTVLYVVARGDWVVEMLPGCGPEAIGVLTVYRAVWSLGRSVQS